MKDLSETAESSRSSRRSKLLAGAAIALFVLALAAFAILAWKPLVGAFEDPAAFRSWIDARGPWGRVLFLGMMTLQVIVAFLPAEPLEIAAGYAFGAFWGTLLVWAGLILGSLAVFLFVRKLGVKAVEVFFPREQIDSVRFLNDEKKLGAAAFFLFLIPGTPKDLLTYCAGLTKIRLVPWLLLTSIARLPSVLTSTLGGNALGLKRYGLAIAVFAATTALSVLGILLYRARERRRTLSGIAREIAATPLEEGPAPKG